MKYIVKNSDRILFARLCICNIYWLRTNYRQIACHAQTPEKFWTNF